MHGNLGSSADWVVTGPSNGLAFLLADSGYDVWLGNNRGNTYSKNHTMFLETSYGFWDFSWHEMGIYDLPAMIDFILQITGQKQLFYIGYSQGGTQFFVMNSMKPEYNDKIRLGVTFAPAVFLGNTKGAINLLSKLSYPIGWRRSRRSSSRLIDWDWCLVGGGRGMRGAPLTVVRYLQAWRPSMRVANTGIFVVVLVEGPGTCSTWSLESRYALLGGPRQRRKISRAGQGRHDRIREAGL
ncbi:lipase 3-like [Belonocnema kinseyi]|uniref:lipase 3-like n=1 Tax=Belonocnema kinseyi TaxID=2817044 RepID=UPI00143CCB5B|nr:lipase 3-like [Belonocnema kinseyi]